MRLLHVINLSEVNAYDHLTNIVLSRSSYVVMFILLSFYPNRYWICSKSNNQCCSCGLSNFRPTAVILTHSRKIRNNQLRFVFRNFSFVCQNNLRWSKNSIDHAAPLVIVIVERILFHVAYFSLLCIHVKEQTKYPKSTGQISDGIWSANETCFTGFEVDQCKHSFGHNSAVFQRIVTKFGQMSLLVKSFHMQNRLIR